MVSSGGGDGCARCGAPLQPDHRFCPACGARRPPAGPPPRLPVLLPVAFAAGAVFWLLLLAQTAAVFASANGRAQLTAQLIAAGMPARDATSILAADAILVGGLLLAAAGLHWLAYRGLRLRRRWGWVVGLALAVLWSPVLLGIPVLITLLRRDVRAACS